MACAGLFVIIVIVVVSVVERRLRMDTKIIGIIYKLSQLYPQGRNQFRRFYE